MTPAETGAATGRQRLREALCQEDQLTAASLSALVGLPIKDVLAHLEHVRKGVRPPLRFLVEPARCLACGFVFKDRRRLPGPGRCPRCKSTHVSEPAFSIR